jgi:hypothetical protein
MTLSDPTGASRDGFLPDVDGLSNVNAALAYAGAGACIVPVRPGTKDTGSFLGREGATLDVGIAREGDVSPDDQ